MGMELEDGAVGGGMKDRRERMKARWRLDMKAMREQMKAIREQVKAMSEEMKAMRRRCRSLGRT